MYRLKSFFLSLKITDPRQKNCLLLSSAKVVDDYSLTIIQKSMGLKMSGEHVDGFKQYLECWEKSYNASPIFYTENAVYLQDKKFFDDVTVIATAYDLLHCRYGLPADFKRSFGSEENWQRLVEVLATAGSFKLAVCREFKIDTFSTLAFKHFGERENFQQWLLWLWCKLQNSGYLARCAKASASTEEFVTQIYELIFSFANEKFFDEFCNERREVLSLMKILPPKSFVERTRQADKRLALKILTNNSQAERLMILRPRVAQSSCQ